MNGIGENRREKQLSMRKNGESLTTSSRIKRYKEKWMDQL